MNRRTIRQQVAVAALTILFAGQALAVGPFSRRLHTPHTTPPTTRRIPAQILNSPEKMTKIFGPSILVRQKRAPEKKSRFVTQPN